ncbi:hypothetical protein Anapl_02099 [Anas platyrhynchos]|uniref:Uncharacterized protein n=1 Tax=Anas platyrhynchos TaxID=8839 RepID=R0LXE9_ANAPL|nr:hypothetical protein Anapl_02099 [Anas platyrhynchos]
MVTSQVYIEESRLSSKSLKVEKNTWQEIKEKKKKLLQLTLVYLADSVVLVTCGGPEEKPGELRGTDRLLREKVRREQDLWFAPKERRSGSGRCFHGFQVQHPEDVFCALGFAVSVIAPGKFSLPPVIPTDVQDEDFEAGVFVGFEGSDAGTCRAAPAPSDTWEKAISKPNRSCSSGLGRCVQWGLQLAPAGPVSVFVIMSKSSSARSDGLDTAGGAGARGEPAAPLGAPASWMQRGSSVNIDFIAGFGAQRWLSCSPGICEGLAANDLLAVKRCLQPPDPRFPSDVQGFSCSHKPQTCEESKCCFVCLAGFGSPRAICERKSSIL